MITYFKDSKLSKLRYSFVIYIIFAIVIAYFLTKSEDNVIYGIVVNKTIIDTVFIYLLVIFGVHLFYNHYLRNPLTITDEGIYIDSNYSRKNQFLNFFTCYLFGKNISKSKNPSEKYTFIPWIDIKKIRYTMPGGVLLDFFAFYYEIMITCRDKRLFIQPINDRKKLKEVLLLLLSKNIIQKDKIKM